MKAKTDKMPKLKKPKIKGQNTTARPKPETKEDEGFAQSKALSPQEIKALKEHLEDLNQQNTTGG